jgi:hypothetical protein
MKKIFLLCTIALLGLSTETFAQGYGKQAGGGYDRGDRQRVRRGVRSGQITRDEARQLRERERQIRQERRAYRSDGTLSREERREIRRDEREQDRLTRRYRRNDDRRSDYYNYDGDNYDRQRGNGYYRRGAGSARHPVFGTRNRY